jgi:hypothetical protein
MLQQQEAFVQQVGLQHHAALRVSNVLSVVTACMSARRCSTLLCCACRQLPAT